MPAKPPADAAPCTYAGCAVKPTRRIDRGPGLAPWFGCPVHAPAMARSFHRPTTAGTRT